MRCMATNQKSEISADDWQLFASRLITKLPGRTSGARHKWLQDKTGISASTSQNWISKTGDKATEIPSLTNLFKIADLLEISLTQLITIVQEQMEPPVPHEGITAKTIQAIADIDHDEAKMLAQGLKDLSWLAVNKAGFNLLEIAQKLQASQSSE